MFPKFLRVTPLTVNKFPVRINESTTIFKTRLATADKLRINVLAEALGFSYKVVLASDGVNYGNRLPNGTWTGAYGMLQRRETDLVFSLSTLGEATNEDFLLSFPHAISDVTFATRKPEPVPDPAVFLHPFSIQVWLSIIACVCLMPLIFNFLLRKKHSGLNLLTSTLGSLVGQGMEQIPKRIRECFVFGAWIIGSAFLYYFYAAVLLSFVTSPSLHGVRTIDDLANGIKDGKYQTTTHPFSTYGNDFSKINVASFQVIGKHLQEDKQKRTPEFVKFLELSSDRKKPAFVGVREDLLIFKEQYFISEESFYSTAQVLVMNKDFCCASEVDKIIHRVWASRIFQKFRERIEHYYFRKHLQTYGKYWQDTPSEAQLTMMMLKGPFIFLTISHLLAFIVFLMEVCIGKLKNLRSFKNVSFSKSIAA